jgi:hypothetical protein
LTGRTLTGESQLRAALAEIAEQGWALLDREYESNMRAIAAPVRDYDGTVVASIGCMCHGERVSLKNSRRSFCHGSYWQQRPSKPSLGRAAAYLASLLKAEAR